MFEIVGNVVAIPDSQKEIFVQGDNQTNVLSFKVPRYSGEMDLSTLRAMIKTKNKYELYDFLYPQATVEDDFVILDWDVASTSTLVNGELEVQIQFQGIITATQVSPVWQSTIFTLTVSGSLISDEEIYKTSPTAFMQWAEDFNQIREDVTQTMGITDGIVEDISRTQDEIALKQELINTEFMRIDSTLDGMQLAITQAEELIEDVAALAEVAKEIDVHKNAAVAAQNASKASETAAKEYADSAKLSADNAKASETDAKENADITSANKIEIENIKNSLNLGLYYTKTQADDTTETLQGNIDTLENSLSQVELTLTAQNTELSEEVDLLREELSDGATLNKFTTAEKNKLSGVEAGAQENTIESISINSVPVNITNKQVDIQLSGSSGGSVAVINSLDSTSTTAALAAAQGKVLADKMQLQTGTWTPSINEMLGEITKIYTATWAKQGNIVHIYANIDMNITLAFSTTFILEGLPFTSIERGIINVLTSGSIETGSIITGYTSANGCSFIPTRSDNSILHLTYADLGVGSRQLRFAGIYFCQD